MAKHDNQRMIELRGYIIATRKGSIINLNHATLAYFLCPADIRNQLADLGFDILKHGNFMQIDVHIVRDTKPDLSNPSQDEIGVFYTIKKPSLDKNQTPSTSQPVLSKFTATRSLNTH